MASIVRRLADRNLAGPPKWLPDNTQFESLMGSVAYGVADDTSDYDVYGFCIPPKDLIFPHLQGIIPGFGRQIPHFEQYQQHHIYDKDALTGKGRTYDLTIFSIVKYFHLAMNNNPNMVDSLFVPQNCILHITKVGQMVRENRRLFLTKKSWHTFKGYAYAQLHKMDIKNPEAGSTRAETVERFGYDVKFGYHVVRLIDEVHQILETGDLILGRNNEQLKEIRRGGWTAEQVREYFTQKESELEQLYAKSELRYGPDGPAIKTLLIACLEEHYETLEGAIVQPEAAVQALNDISAIIERYNRST